MKMTKTSVTISLVPEASEGPFLFQGNVDRAFETAASLGFDGVELFLPSAETINPAVLRRKLADNGLRLSALGTGAGFLIHGWTLCSPQESIRQEALEYIADMMFLGAEFQAPVIVGSMKGSVLREANRDSVLARLVEDLADLSERAEKINATILLEPLNRYETNLINTLREGAALLDRITGDHVRLLADLFHMNIEEESIFQALRKASKYVGYIHFVDSNRRPAGSGHLDFEKLGSVLEEIQYQGFLSAEALPYPNSDEAARRTLETYHRYIEPNQQEEN